ncbi:Holliday junction DNA helicase RuvB C-terminal domain-containing protein [Persephonella sp.]
MILNLKHIELNIDERELSKKINEILGKALFKYIKERIKKDKENSKRLFYSIKNIDNSILKEFIRLFDKEFKLIENSYKFEEFKIILITIDKIEGYSHLKIPSDKTATYYRDNLKENEILILILNKETSDSQSLKNIFEINESSLAENSWDIIRNTIYEDYDDFKIYFENSDDLKNLLSIVEKDLTFNKSLFQITAYIYLVIDTYLKQGRNNLLESMYNFLPVLKFFRVKQYYNPKDDKKNLKKLLKKMEEFYINHLNFENHEIKKYTEKIEKLNIPTKEFKNDSFIQDKYFNEDEVKNILKDFVQANSEDALFLEWEDYILPLLGKKIALDRNPCLEDLEDLINSELIEDKKKFLEDIKRKLNTKKTILPEEAESIINEYELSARCKKFFKKFIALKEIRGYDLELLLLKAVIELKTSIEGDWADNIKVKIYIDPKEKEVNGDFLNIFNLYYKNLDHKLSEESIIADFSAVENLDYVEEKKDLRLKVELVKENKTLKSVDVVWSPNNLMEVTNYYISSLKSSKKIFNYSLRDNLISLEELDIQHLVRAEKYFVLDEIYKTDLLKDNQDLISLLKKLEETYISLVNKIGQEYGLVVATEDIGKILELYNEVLKILDEKFKNYDSIKKIYPKVLNLFCISNFPKSSIISILHPLKMLWVKNKFLNISRHIKEILEGKKNIGDEKIFIENIENIYSSKLLPAISTNFVSIGKSTYFSSEYENSGYELHNHVETDNPVSLEYSLENKANKILNSTLDHYLALYPYRSNNINICLLDLGNIHLLKEISNYDKGFYKKRLFIHTYQQAIKIYESVKRNIENNEIKLEKLPLSIFPNIEYEIYQKKDEKQFLDEIKEKNIDIGFLYKFFDDKYTQIVPKKEDFEPQNIEEFFPPIQIVQEPYKEGSSTKKRTLNHFKTAEIVKNFYNLCYIFEETMRYQSRDIPSLKNDSIIIFNESFEFDKERDFIEKIHETFNWAVFYEKNVDKEVIEKSLKETAVIKYFANIGEKGEYNFLISTRKNETLLNKIKESLKEYIPASDFGDETVQILVNEAKKISGDLVLKATNLGYFFNELFGAVLSKIEIEKELGEGQLLSWIYMDDVSHWYSSKSKVRPDIAMINIKIDNGKTVIDMGLIEAKFISSTNLDSTKKEVVKQLKNGYKRFNTLFAPNMPNIDSLYWYYSLYNTIISKLDYKYNVDERFLRKIKKDILSTGNFELNIKLYANIYCYDIEKPDENYTEEDINFYIRYKNSILSLLKSLDENYNQFQTKKNSKSIFIKDKSIENTQTDSILTDKEKVQDLNQNQKETKHKEVTKVIIQTNQQINENNDHIDVEIEEVFKDFIGNEMAVRKIKTFVKHAYKQSPKKLAKNIIFTGEASTGKTYLSKLIAKALKLPFFAISAPALDSLDTLLERMELTLKENNLNLEKIGESGGLPVVKFPPMVVFIDEAHKLKPKLQQELLTALEPKDRKAYTLKYIADLSDVTFLFATTDKGDLINPLKTRLTFIELKPYKKEEVIQILRKNYPDLPEEVLERIAIAGRLIPRVALELASDLIIESEAYNVKPTLELLENSILKVNGIDEIGLNEKDRKYLEILSKADRELGISNIANQLGIGESEVTEDIEPYLLKLGFIERTKSGRRITPKGKEYLRRYNVNNKKDFDF